MQITGKIKKIFEEQTFPSGFRKKELVIVTQDQYPQQIIVEFIKEKIELLGSFKEGDDIVISININGREWINAEGVAKYFNSIQGWRVEKQNGTTDLSSQNVAQPQNNPTVAVNLDADESEVDDLPF
jgi:single-strand DNA-binding protein